MHPSSVNSRVCEDRIKNKHVRRMFCDISHVSNMIATCQLDFIGNTVRGPFDRPAQQLLPACCGHTQQVRCPFLHIKDLIVKNLCLLFANVLEVTIDNNGSLKNWIREALHEHYWNQLVVCLIDRQAQIHPRPNEWPRPQQSPRTQYTIPPDQQPFPPTHNNFTPE